MLVVEPISSQCVWEGWEAGGGRGKLRPVKRSDVRSRPSQMVSSETHTHTHIYYRSRIKVKTAQVRNYSN